MAEGATLSHDTMALRYDTAQQRHDMARGSATTQRTELRYARHSSCGTEAIRPRGGLRHNRARPATRRRVRAGWAKIGCTVHSTKFLTQCTVSVNV